MRDAWLRSAALLVFAAGCSSEEETGCDQECKDTDVAYAIVATLVDVFNANLAGQPVGSQNETANCPAGGSVVITGSTGYSEQTEITTLDLTYSMTGCHYVSGGYDLTFDGSLTEEGSFSEGNMSLVYASTSVTYAGTGGSAGALNDTCSFTFTRSYSEISGTLCGRSFSYIY